MFSFTATEENKSLFPEKGGCFFGNYKIIDDTLTIVTCYFIFNLRRVHGNVRIIIESEKGKYVCAEDI